MYWFQWSFRGRRARAALEASLLRWLEQSAREDAAFRLSRVSR